VGEKKKIIVFIDIHCLILSVTNHIFIYSKWRKKISIIFYFVFDLQIQTHYRYYDSQKFLCQLICFLHSLCDWAEPQNPFASSGKINMHEKKVTSCKIWVITTKTRT